MSTFPLDAVLVILVILVSVFEICQCFDRNEYFFF